MAKQSSPHIVTLLDDVEKCEREVVEALLSLPDKAKVQIVINSGGGSVYASLGIATVIKMKQFQAEAIVLADCSSSALLVFAACQTRRVAPHASFLFHPMKWTSEESARLSAAQSWSAEFRRVAFAAENWVVEHMGLPRRTLRRWIREERYVEAPELFALGIAEPLNLTQGKVIELFGRKKAAAAAGNRRGAAARAVRVRKAG